MVVRDRDVTVIYKETRSPLVDFLNQIKEPLAAFSASSREIEELISRYTAPDGIIHQRAIETINEFSKTMNVSGPVPPTILDFWTQGFERAYLQELFPRDKTISKGVDLNVHKMRRKSDPRQVEQLEEMGDRIAIQLRTQYDNERRIPLETKRERQATLESQLVAWIESDFSNLLILASPPADPSSEFQDLLSFIAEGQIDKVKQVSYKAMRKETERPTPQRVVSFLDQLGIDYYQNPKGRKGNPWPLLIFLLGRPEREIELLYTQPSPTNEQIESRRRLLFETVLNNLESGQVLPEPLLSLYSTYVARLHLAELSKLREMAEKQIKPPYNIRPITTPKEFRQFTASPQLREDETPEPDHTQDEKPKAGKIILINGTAITDEQAIGPALEALLREKSIKDVRSGDLENYSMILAKLAGARPNAPNYRLEKLTSFPRQPLSDGTSEPVYRLRLNPKGPPRILLTFHQDYLIIITALKREDTTYMELMKKGGFFEIHLPS